MTSASSSSSSSGSLGSSLAPAVAASVPTGPIHLSHLITIKLTSDNFLFWRAQIAPLLRSHLLMGYVDGTNRCPPSIITTTAAASDAPTSRLNPDYTAWVQQDQAILTAIVSSMTVEVVGMVLFASTSHEAWTTIEGSFASQSTARSMQIRAQLNATWKLDSSATAYFNKVKALSDTLTSIGQPLRPEEFTSFLLNGLDEEYDSLVEVVSARDMPMPLSDLYARLLSTEQRVEGRRSTEFNVNTHSAKMARMNGNGKSYRTYNGSAPNNGSGATNGNTSGNGYNKQPGNGKQQQSGNGNAGRNTGNRPVCQLCGLTGHIASRCHKRFNRGFLGIGNDGRNNERQAAQAMHGQTPSYPIDASWYMDTGATDHLTGDLDKLQVKEPYQGKEKVHTANGAGSGYEGNTP